MPKSLPARIGYILWGALSGAVILSLAVAAWSLVKIMMTGGASYEAGLALGRGLPSIALGVGVPFGALLGAFILQDSAKQEEERRGLGAAWIAAVAIAAAGVYLASG